MYTPLFRFSLLSPYIHIYKNGLEYFFLLFSFFSQKSSTSVVHTVCPYGRSLLKELGRALVVK
jgi:hypothetical protein